MNGLELEQNRDYCAVRFEPDLQNMAWSDVEKSTGEVVNKLQEIEPDRLLIDLSDMRMIHSGLVASLVRIWKSTNRKDSRVIVVSPHEVVTEVLQSAGLTRLFAIHATRDDAMYELGVSPVARMEQRERRVVAWAALPCSVLAVAALVPVHLLENVSVQWNAELIAGLLAGFGSVTGILSLATDRGWRRWLGLLALIIGLAVLATLWFRRNPLEVLQPEPPKNIQQPAGTPDQNGLPPATDPAPARLGDAYDPAPDGVYPATSDPAERSF